jgi:hypothetical protein
LALLLIVIVVNDNTIITHVCTQSSHYHSSWVSYSQFLQWAWHLGVVARSKQNKNIKGRRTPLWDHDCSEAIIRYILMHRTLYIYRIYEVGLSEHSNDRADTSAACSDHVLKHIVYSTDNSRSTHKLVWQILYTSHHTPPMYHTNVFTKHSHHPNKREFLAKTKYSKYNLYSIT